MNVNITLFIMSNNCQLIYSYYIIMLLYLWKSYTPIIQLLWLLLCNLEYEVVITVCEIGVISPIGYSLQSLH
jgi:hypothetical protein